MTSAHRPTVFLVTPATAPAVPPDLVDALAMLADVVVGSTPVEFAAVADQVDVIQTWAGGNPRPLLEPFAPLPPRLRWISHAGIGVDQFLYPALIESEVEITNMRGVDFYADSMAEFAFSLVLLFARELLRIERNRMHHSWERVMGVSVWGKTLGIVGLGTIGAELARRATSFGMSVMATKRTPNGMSLPGVTVKPPTALQEILPYVDYLVICAPRTAETHGLIDAAALRLMKSEAVLINIARGGIVDEPALLDALQHGRLRGAALDVFGTEPLPPDSPLWDVPNLFISPHMSALVDRPGDRQYNAIVENVQHFLRGEPLVRVVDKRRGY